jgi:DNA polymerase-1
LQLISDTKPLFLDIEVSENDELLAVGYAFGNGELRVSPGLPRAVEATLLNPNSVVVTHTKFDIRWLRQHGVDVRAELHDTQVLGWLLNENTELSLAALAKRYLAVEMDKRVKQVANRPMFTTDDGKQVPMSEAPWNQLARYCRDDVKVLRELYQRMAETLDYRYPGLLEHYLNQQVPFTKVLLDMELNGLPVNLQAVEELRKEFTAERDALAAELTKDAPMLNLRSPQHVKQYLTYPEVRVNDRLPKTEDLLAAMALDMLTSAGESAGVGTLTIGPHTFEVTKVGRQYLTGRWCYQGLNDSVAQYMKDVNRNTLLTAKFEKPETEKWVQAYLAWKRYDKLLNTYIEVFQRVAAKDGRIYANFNQTGTVTGRLSSSNPNLQNIPARTKEGQKIREVIQGNLIVGDFAQLEPRLMAHFSQDPALLDIFRNNRDLYQETADRLKITRNEAKTLILAMGYGAGPDKIAKLLYIAGATPNKTVVELTKYSQELLDDLRKLYKTYFAWRQHIIISAQDQGFVTTLDGRYRRFTGSSWHWKSGDGRPDRQAANAVVQGSAADVVRRVMLYTSRRWPNLKLLAQVHDELLWEYDPEDPPSLPDLKREIEAVAGDGLSVPMVFDVHFGSSWASAKSGTENILADLFGDEDEEGE